MFLNLQDSVASAEKEMLLLDFYLVFVLWNLRPVYTCLPLWIMYSNHCLTCTAWWYRWWKRSRSGLMAWNNHHESSQSHGGRQLKTKTANQTCGRLKHTSISSSRRSRCICISYSLWGVSDDNVESNMWWGGGGVQSLAISLVFFWEMCAYFVDAICSKWSTGWLRKLLLTSSSSHGSASDQYLIVHVNSQCVLLTYTWPTYWGNVPHTLSKRWNFGVLAEVKRVPDFVYKFLFVSIDVRSN